MSAKQDSDKKDPRYPWTARQRRAKLGARKSRKVVRHDYLRPKKSRSR
jgi:hypothetical protein